PRTSTAFHANILNPLSRRPVYCVHACLDGSPPEVPPPTALSAPGECHLRIRQPKQRVRRPKVVGLVSMSEKHETFTAGPALMESTLFLRDSSSSPVQASVRLIGVPSRADRAERK